MTIELSAKSKSIEESILGSQDYKTLNQKISEEFVRLLLDSKLLTQYTQPYQKHKTELIKENFEKYNSYILESPEEQDLHERLTNIYRNFELNWSLESYMKSLREIFIKLANNKALIAGFTPNEDLIISKPQNWEFKRKTESLLLNFRRIPNELIVEGALKAYPDLSKAEKIKEADRIRRLTIKTMEESLKAFNSTNFERFCTEFREKPTIFLNFTKDERLLFNSILLLSNIEYESYKVKEWWLNKNEFELLNFITVKSSVKGCPTCEINAVPTPRSSWRQYRFDETKETFNTIRATHRNLILKNLKSFRKADLSDPRVKEKLIKKIKNLEAQARFYKDVRDSSRWNYFGDYEGFSQGKFTNHICPVALDRIKIILLNEGSYMEFKSNSEINEISVETELYLELRDYRYLADVEYSKSAKEKQFEKLRTLDINKVLERMLEVGGYYINEAKEQSDYVKNGLKLLIQIYSTYEEDRSIDDLSIVREEVIKEFDKTRNYTPDISLIYAKKAAIAFEQMSEKKIDRMLSFDTTDLTNKFDRTDTIMLASIHSLTNI